MDIIIQNNSDVLNRGKQAGLDLNSVPKSIQKEVTSLMSQTDDKRLKGKVEIDGQDQKLQAADRASKDKHLIGTVIKKTAVNLFDHSGERKSLPVDTTLIILPMNRE